MAGIPVMGSNLEEKIRRRLRTQPEVNANPTLADIAYAYAASQAGERLKEKKFGEEVSLEQAKNAELQRQSLIKDANARDMLSTWKSQNNIATLLGAANLVATGAGGYIGMKRAEDREARSQGILNTMKETIAKQTEFNRGLKESQNVFIDELWKRRLANPRYQGMDVGTYYNNVDELPY